MAFDDFVDVLERRKPMPVSKFISYSGRLSWAQVTEVARGIESNLVSGGIKLEGRVFSRIFHASSFCGHLAPPST